VTHRVSRSTLRDLTAIGLCEAAPAPAASGDTDTPRRITPLQPGTIMSSFYISYAVSSRRR
jgi:hypothetical protein